MGKTNNNTTITEIVAYNLITIYKEEDGYYHYYLEKKNYGHLFYMFGTKEKIEPDKQYLQEYINQAEEENFWGYEE